MDLVTSWGGMSYSFDEYFERRAREKSRAAAEPKRISVDDDIDDKIIRAIFTLIYTAGGLPWYLITQVLNMLMKESDPFLRDKVLWTPGIIEFDWMDTVEWEPSDLLSSGSSLRSVSWTPMLLDLDQTFINGLEWDHMGGYGRYEFTHPPWYNDGILELVQ